MRAWVAETSTISEKDFTPINSVTTAYYFLAVRKEMPVNSVAELIAWLKANPATASYGWGAAVAQMAGADFVKRIGAPVVGVSQTASGDLLVATRTGVQRLDAAWQLRGALARPIRRVLSFGDDRLLIFREDHTLELLQITS